MSTSLLLKRASGMTPGLWMIWERVSQDVRGGSADPAGLETWAYRLAALQPGRALDKAVGGAKERGRLRRVLVRSLVEEDAVHGQRAGVAGPARVDAHLARDVGEAAGGIARPYVPDGLYIWVRVEAAYGSVIMDVGPRAAPRPAVGVHNDGEVEVRPATHAAVSSCKSSPITHRHGGLSAWGTHASYTGPQEESACG
ncbi:hypothetical protein J3459_013042 [Metarhizium acridum]|nr:hypothetical protein J3459_013042 [Metarhizium acridum]